MTDADRKLEAKAFFKCVCGAEVAAFYDPATGAASVRHPLPTCDTFDLHEDPTEYVRAVRRARQG